MAARLSAGLTPRVDISVYGAAVTKRSMNFSSSSRSVSSSTNARASTARFESSVVKSLVVLPRPITSSPFMYSAWQVRQFALTISTPLLVVVAVK